MVNNIQDNDLILLIVGGILIMLLLALAFIVFFNLSQKKILQEKMKAQSLQLEHQEELLHATLMTQEEERRRIAKDLHDDIGSKLNVIKLNLHRVRQLGQADDLKSLVKEVQGLISTTIQTTRRISHDLLPPVLDKFGLVAALEELCEQSSRSDQLTVDFEVENEADQPDADNIKLNIFRIVQEMMSNSIRHGQASSIQIRLYLKPDDLELHYEDNGKGFDASQIEEQKGLGLRNMDSRAKMMGAQIQYESTPGKGMKARLFLLDKQRALNSPKESIAKI